MTSPRIIRNFLLATTLAWGFSSSMVRAFVGDTPLPALVVELQGMTPDEREKTFQWLDGETSTTPPLPQEAKRQWLRTQWAALSPDQRGQLRTQVRDHWQHMPPEQRQRLREENRVADEKPDPAPALPDRQDEVRPQRLSPDERQEFRQWMRERRESGHDGRGGRGPGQ